ncbi:MAG: MazG nucleotide pyrophosphohydrolase domain-containing protein [Corynebacterium sp.]|nr:MazG nucleotide pyrophosphohydrolase domain-containing protein [Corynebacterium sp.]
MTVLLLDDRWPEVVPLDIIGKLAGPVTFATEIPVKVRWNIDVLLNPGVSDSCGTYISCDELDPEVVRRSEAGERVIAVASRADALHQAQQVMTRALRIGEWEQSQTHQSLLPYLHEEAAEFAEAVEQQLPDAAIKAELADVFLQVLFHSEIASRRGAFGLADVAESFIAKLRVRAPYLFDGTVDIVDQETQDRLWQEAKAGEKSN